MAWSCVEDRTADGQFGRVLRKIVFDDIYADRTALLSRHPIPLHSLAQLKAGDRIAFYDNTSIREGNFLCSSHSHKLSAKDILTHILQTEEELKQFCEANSINTKNQHIFALVIEAFILLTKKVEYQHAFYSNGGFVDHTVRKRPAEWNVNDYLPSRKQQQMSQQMAAAAAAASNGGLHPSVLNEINRSLMAQALRNSQLQFAQAAAQQQASQQDEQLAQVTELTEAKQLTKPITPPITNCTTTTTPSKTEPSQSDQLTLEMTPSDQTEPRKTVIEENNSNSPKSASGEITELKDDEKKDTSTSTKSEVSTNQTNSAPVIDLNKESPTSNATAPPVTTPATPSPKEKTGKNGKSTPMKRKPLLMKTKLEILDEYKKGSKLSDIARRRGLNASTVHYIINQGRKKVEWNHMLMQKYNYISEMGSNPPSYDPHRGIDLGTMPVPPPSSVAHSLAIDDKASFSASFQPFSLPRPITQQRGGGGGEQEQSPLSDLLINNQMAHQLVQAVNTIKESLNKKSIMQ